MSENEITIEERTAPETIVILGAPGSGKDTQSEFLSSALGYQIISTGELMRILAGHNDEIREKLEKGELIPDSIVEDELISVFVLLPDGQPVILDGYPRSLEQAQKLQEILEENSRRLDRVIYIELSEAEAVKRIGKRRVCSKCGKFTDDKSKMCSQCGGNLKIRDDDKSKSVKHRIKIFKENNDPIVKYYEEMGILAKVDGTPSPDKVKEKIRKIL